MKAFVTSINEPTTELCVWSLRRNGFDVEVVDSNHLPLLADKLEYIYQKAEEDFLRVDADIVVNRNMTPEFLKNFCDQLPHIWWWQFRTFDWFKQDTNHAMAYIKREALPVLRANISAFKTHLRPETMMSRLPEFYEPRRFETYSDEIMGLHGYGIKDLEPVKQLKKARRQSELYDFELTERLNKL